MGMKLKILKPCASLALSALPVLVLQLVFLSACGSGGTSRLGWPGINDPARVNFSAAYDAVTRFNEHRRSAGVQTVDLDYDLSRGCQLHADYLKHNSISLNAVGLNAHTEDSLNPHYSEAGASAGRSSVIYEGVTAVDAVDRWMRTFYHRLGMLDPNLHHVGYGSSGSYQVMDVLHGRIRGEYSAHDIVFYPPAGAQDIHGRFENEIPWPVPGDQNLGIPVSVEFFGPLEYNISSVEAWLQDLSSGQLVPCHLQYPGKPLLADWDTPGVIALIPADPLPGGHVFRVYMSAFVNREPWKHSWEFRTR
jgi:hypothetical protein